MAETTTKQKRPRRGLSENGSSSPNYAITTTILMIVIWSLAQVGFAVLEKRTLQLAADRAASTAARFGGSDAEAERAANNVLSQVSKSQNPTTNIKREGDMVTVTVRGQPDRIMPFTINLKATASVPVEQ